METKLFSEEVKIKVKDFTEKAKAKAIAVKDWAVEHPDTAFWAIAGGLYVVVVGDSMLTQHKARKVMDSEAKSKAAYAEYMMRKLD